VDVIPVWNVDVQCVQADRLYMIAPNEVELENKSLKEQVHDLKLILSDEQDENSRLRAVVYIIEQNHFDLIEKLQEQISVYQKIFNNYSKTPR